MRSLLPRLAVLGAFALSVSACSGSGSTLPFAGPPVNSGGNPGTFVAGSHGPSLVRFVQASPDYGKVDVCIDQAPLNITTTGISFKGSALGVVGGGVSHTIAVYPASAA